jgi:hypothetical protein
MKGLSHTRLAATLLDMIAQDDLCDAVLDEEALECHFSNADANPSRRQ